MTKSTFFVEEDKILSALFEEGLDNLHLYKPETEPVYSERLLTLLSEDYYKRITVHDHFYLKDEFKLKGIHINDITTPAPIGYRGDISYTCHRIEEIKDVKKRSNYVFLKSIFDSQSDKDDRSTFTIDQLEDAAREGLIDKKVYALGGMNLDNLRIAKDLGFGGVVICGDLWNRFDIHQQMDYKELISHFRKLKKAVS